MDLGAITGKIIGEDPGTLIVYGATRARARIGAAVNRLTGRCPRVRITCDVDGPGMLETYLAQGHADEYLDLCQGRIRGLTVFMTTRNLDGLAVPGLGAMLGELLDRARSRGIRIDVQSHGSTHVDFRSLALDEQVENISTSIGDLGDAGHSVEEFRPPSLFMNMDTYRACHILGIRGPVARNVPSDYHLMEAANLPAEEGREFIRRECRKELGRGRDLVVLFHFERIQDERAPALLGEYLEVAESTGDG